MRIRPLFSLAIISTLTLGACQATTRGTAQATLSNPLVAEQHNADLIERLSSLLATKDPKWNEGRIGKRLEYEVQNALKAREAATATLRTGTNGPFAKVEEDILGKAALVGNTLYFGADFLTYPGPELHVYLTTVMDPTTAEFPDPTAIDLGPLASAYGAQAYLVPQKKEQVGYITVVLYDSLLKRIYGFAQLSK